MCISHRVASRKKSKIDAHLLLPNDLDLSRPLLRVDPLNDRLRRLLISLEQDVISRPVANEKYRGEARISRRVEEKIERAKGKGKDREQSDSPAIVLVNIDVRQQLRRPLLLDRPILPKNNNARRRLSNDHRSD